MKLIAKNDEVISFLSNNESLISGTIESIKIQNKSNVLCIGLNINLMYSKTNKTIFLEFKLVKEYGFFYSSSLSFYNIERFKFFKDDNLFYISFDPFSEQEEMGREENDNDFILSQEVYLYSMIE
ncbi:hypothetical protein [Emticicia sp. TH156]|uniref:hypothetical protein n=1 Tax=Emticicia sp. TH156 TaxID=2067454 RepID=UPI000C75ED9B|nr:hypothetical protein [Emticicia sp. TH156]PLK44196.1 hypothetical protein C0V77_10360 [Emticicia sp. TH156]